MVNPWLLPPYPRVMRADDASKDGRLVTLPRSPQRPPTQLPIVVVHRKGGGGGRGKGGGRGGGGGGG